MVKKTLFLLFFFGGLWNVSSLSAFSFQVIEGDFLWISPNLTRPDSVPIQRLPQGAPAKKKDPLSLQSFRNYFDRFGRYPSYPFLKPFKEEDAAVARIRENHLLFPQTGKEVPLDLSAIPSWATPVPPYLLGAKNLPWVIVVYPYYLHQEKENRYRTEIYSDRGDLMLTHDSLPTHVSGQNPNLFVAPERSGCCESLKWTIRFYDLQRAVVSEYGCPEGFCGDMLFTRLGEKGPFLIAQEIVGSVGEIGASMQTNLSIIEPDGRLSASGKILYALRDTQISRPKAESLSPYAISKLISADPLPEKKGWTFRFGEDSSRTLKLAGFASQAPPSIAYLLSKDPSRSGGRTIRVGGRNLGTLPLLAVSTPGLNTFDISYADGRREAVVREIRSDFVNVLMF